MPGWDGFPIRERLAQKWGRPVFVDNDADLGALGEGTFGAGRGEPNLAYIKVGTGIGCGILLDGHIYRGVHGTAGEIGHVTISEDGPPCTCGNYGCLEAMAGGRAIAQRAQLAIKAGQRTALTTLNHNGEVSARDVGRHIGGALASLINLLNPGLVLVGGGVAGAGEFLLNPIRAAAQERSMRAAFQSTRIELATLSARSVIMGALSLAMTQTFKSYVEAV
jgi:predicted NBD/HSP70 family sugar kinase